jgi:omega-hydroxy-beta-dihydromenaquinone-9 sulfotransferase
VVDARKANVLSAGIPGVEKPLIIVGTGRCGSTMLHRLLARHEDVGWLSTWNESFPSQTWLATFSNLYRTALPDRLKEAKAFPKPFEAYRFWEHYLPGFSRRDRPQTAADVHEPGIEPVRLATAHVLRRQRRRRLLVKVTGWSRIAYFDRIYPDALFVSLRRDPRAVISSWIKAGWIDVTSPPDSDEWQWGRVEPSLLALWRELGGGPVLTVALKVHLDLSDAAANLALCPDRGYELWYEDVIRQPVPTLRELCAFAGFDWTPAFAAEVESMGFYDPSGKWRSHLSEAQGEVVLEFLRRADALAGDGPTPRSAATR